MAICLWALATRIWPASLGGDVLGARLGEPFDYWNALGGMAALAVPGALWLGARRDAPRVAAALAYPALGVLLLTIMLTQSRGALAAAVLAALVWLAFVPLRLRTAPVLAVAAVGVAPVTAWALSQEAFTAALQPLAVREDAAGTFGLLTVATLAGAHGRRLRGRAHPGHDEALARAAPPRRASAWPPGWPWWPWSAWCSSAPRAAASASSWTS